MPTIKDMLPDLKAAYESTFAICEDLAEDDSRTAEVAFNTQTILNLLIYVIENPTQVDLSQNFGQLTVDALDSYINQIETPSSSTPPLHKARYIGQELLALEAAIDQGSIAYSNAHFREEDFTKANYYDSELFTKLSQRREKLRKDLLAIDWSEGSLS